MSPDNLLEHPLEEPTAEFVRLCRRGESPSIDEFAARHPAHAEQIRQLLPTLLLMERCSPLREAAVCELRPVTKSREFPRSLGEFLLLREVGRGGMGVVYEAEQTGLGRR